MTAPSPLRRATLDAVRATLDGGVTTTGHAVHMSLDEDGHLRADLLARGRVVASYDVLVVEAAPPDPHPCGHTTASLYCPCTVVELPEPDPR